MGSFFIFYSMGYLLVVVDYVLKWIKVVALPNNEGRSITTFLKRNIFS